MMAALLGYLTRENLTVQARTEDRKRLQPSLCHRRASTELHRGKWTGTRLEFQFPHSSRFVWSPTSGRGTSLPVGDWASMISTSRAEAHSDHLREASTRRDRRRPTGQTAVGVSREHIWLLMDRGVGRCIRRRWSGWLRGAARGTASMHRVDYSQGWVSSGTTRAGGGGAAQPMIQRNLPMHIGPGPEAGAAVELDPGWGSSVPQIRTGSAPSPSVPVPDLRQKKVEQGEPKRPCWPPS